MISIEQLKEKTKISCLFKAEIGDEVECYVDLWEHPVEYGASHNTKRFPVIAARPGGNDFPILGSRGSGMGRLEAAGMGKHYYPTFTWINDLGDYRFMYELCSAITVVRIIKNTKLL